MSDTDFSSLALHPELLANVASLGYAAMTPIQSQGLPPILAGRDVIGQAQTGSGKTAAFALGVLQKLDIKRFCVQTLVLCPTRELADQVAKEIRTLARTLHNIKVLTLCGGMPFGPQIGSLEHGAHIVVGTPGRIEEHVRKGSLKLDDVHTLVLDEADRMLEMGFQATLDAILEHVPAQRQTLLFSATYPEQIQAIAKRVMNNPVVITVQSTHDSSSIEQHFYHVSDDKERMIALRMLLLQHQPESAVVFCATKRETQTVADTLIAEGFSAIALNGDMEQKDRDQTLVRFAHKSIAVLVATDVAARGLDIDSIDMVINYNLAHDPQVHVHRVGRTGRAGSKGMAFSFFGASDNYQRLLLEEMLGQRIQGEALPDASALNKKPVKPAMSTVQLSCGKKQKIRPGDILGALTGEGAIAGAHIGKISLFDQCAYVAVHRASLAALLAYAGHGKIKGQSFQARLIDGKPQASGRIQKYKADNSAAKKAASNKTGAKGRYKKP
ncbi:MAG TPA: ATP-dependent RNA helicase DbpA [Pseudomonadales bacterium]